MYNILVVEDDSSIRDGLKFYLEQEHFTVYDSENGKGALEKANELKDKIDLILLDINLPDISGFELLGKLKEIKNFPIIYLTADDMETSIVKGLDMGAEDYITKPFKLRELLSRINSVLRRTGTNYQSNIIKTHNIEIDLNGAKVFKEGKPIFLTTLEYKILLILTLNPKVVFTREKILAEIWDVNEEYVNDNTLTVYIKRIREKIEDNPNNPKIIETVRGIGYKIGEIDEK